MTEGMTNGGGVVAMAGRRPRHWNSSSTTAAGGETSKGHCGRWWERRRAGKQADADTCGISELFSLEECDHAVMDCLAATEVGKFPPK